VADLARAHFDAVLGHDGTIAPTDLGTAHGVTVLAYADRQRDAVHCVTVGLSDLAVSTLHPTELICSVRPEQPQAARFLLASTVRVAVDAGGVLTLGATIANATPLLARTQICGVLLTAGLFFDDFDLVGEGDGGIDLQVITLVPLTCGDLARLEREGREAIEDAIDETDADLLDVTRDSLD
jgi:Suppressor of fused protein (SUFU)